MFLSNVAAATEVSDMVCLFKGIFNLDLRKTYDQVFQLLHLRRRALTFGGTIKKLPLSESIVVDLRDFLWQINFLDDTTHYIWDGSNYTSQNADGLKFTIRDLRRTLKGLEKDITHV